VAIDFTSVKKTLQRLQYISIIITFTFRGSFKWTFKQICPFNGSQFPKGSWSQNESVFFC